MSPIRKALGGDFEFSRVKQLNSLTYFVKLILHRPTSPSAPLMIQTLTKSQGASRSTYAIEMLYIWYNQAIGRTG